MGVPATTARVEPVGIKLERGWRTTLAFSLDPDISLWEIEVGLPGFDYGESINTSTQWNDALETMAVQALATMTPFTVKFAYDPNIYDNFKNIRGRNQAITRHFPDGSTLDFYGFPQKIEFDPLVKNQMPTGTITVVPTNTDPTTKEEEDYVLTSVAGT